MATLPNQAVLSEYLAKMNIWYHWRAVWNAVHFLLGSLSAVLSILVAANAGTVASNAGAVPASAKGFMSPIEATVVAATAAVLTFLLTVSKPSEKASGYQDAGRHLESAIALYRGDSSVSLSAAEAEGIKMLK
jgi:hypothetical protein